MGRAARAAGTAWLVAVLLAGCGGGDGDEGTDGAAAGGASSPVASAPGTGGPATSGPATGGAAAEDPGYSTPEEVIAALEAAGLPCTSPEDVASDQLPTARRCVLEGEQLEDVVAVTFGSDAEREAFVETVADPVAGGVLGDGWGVVTVQDTTAERIAAAIGGSPG